MIRTVWPYLAVMLLAAGVFPALERKLRWRMFSFMPPIVLTYLTVTLLAVLGTWELNEPIRAAQSAGCPCATARRPASSRPSAPGRPDSYPDDPPQMSVHKPGRAALLSRYR